MGKVKKQSAFSLVTQARQEGKTRSGVSKDKNHKRSSGNFLSNDSAQKSTRKRKNESLLDAEYVANNSTARTDIRCNKKKKQTKDKTVDTIVMPSASESTNIKSKPGKNKSKSGWVTVHEIDLEPDSEPEIIEITDDKLSSSYTQYSDNSKETRQLFSHSVTKVEKNDEIETEDDIVVHVVSDDEYDSKKKQRRKKERFRKNKQILSETHCLAYKQLQPSSSEMADGLEKQTIAEEDGVCCLQVKDGVLMIMSHPSEFTIKGRAKLLCLSGSVQIMGYDLKADKEEMDVFSPDSNSFVTITTTMCKRDILGILESVKQSCDDHHCDVLKDILKRKGPSVVIKARYLESGMCDLVTNHKPFIHLFETQSDCQVNELLEPVGISVHSSTHHNDFPLLRITDHIQSLLKEWMLGLAQVKKGDDKVQPVMLICGAKDTGKSTINRLLMNSTLNRLDCVYFLDCDVGQSEFTPPESVSLIKVTKPVIGPPFSHQRTPDCSYYFGGITPSGDPDCYIKCVHNCVQYYKSLDTSAPLIVNTMGWITDLGLQLLVDTVRLVEPTYLVQLNTELPHPLYKERSWTDLSSRKLPTCDISKERKSPKQIYLQSEISTRHKPRYSPKDLRNLTTLGYLCENLEPGLSLYSVSPYCVKWEDIGIYCINKGVNSGQIMYALNASVVALCHTDLTKVTRKDETSPWLFNHYDDVPEFTWKGFGLVRGIDAVKKMFYVVTPLSPEELKSVNMLVKGSAIIPDQLLMDQECSKVPYMDGKIMSYGAKGLKPRKRPKVQT